MPDTTAGMNGRAGGAARRHRPDASARHVAELEAENAALRRAVASAGRDAEPKVAAAAATEAEGGHRRLLEAAPNPYLVLRPDAPRFTIAAVSDAYLGATLTRRDEIVGLGVFEALTDDPDRLDATGVGNLRASLMRVLATRAPDRMPVQRYDIRRPDGAFEERHWSPLNLPVLGAGGGVEAIIHHVEDVTGFARLHARSEAMEAEASRQARAVARANADLEAANAALRGNEARLLEVEARQGFLLRLADALRPLHDAAEMQAEACRLLGLHLGAAQVGFGRIDEAQERVTVHRDWNDGRVPSVAGTWRMDDFGPAFVAAMKRGETAAIPDIALDPKTNAPEVAAAYAGIGTRAILDVPLVKGGRMAAMLFVHHPEPRAWSAAEVQAAEETCGRLWDAVERAHAEEALRENRERLEAVVAHAAVGVAQVDLEGRFVLVNDRQCEILGRTREELLQGGVRMLGITHPEDRPGNAALLRRMVEAGEPFAIEKRYVRPDGSSVWVYNHVSLTRDAEGKARYVTALVQDITERRRAEERGKLLMAELNHRVKNTLAVVQSLAAQTARGAPDLPSFAAAFQARLIALARAHDLLTRESWEGAPLAEVARAALEASGARVDLGACAPPGVLLPPAQALALAMALHELATNALKHGALSVPEGRVSVAFGTAPEDGAHVVEWAERGGPRVSGPPGRIGFGLRLLERGLAAQTGMTADLRFEPGGVRCAIRLPPSPAGSAAEGA